ncbi:expressed unknown protein (Partial), partial [Seminavis robusta]
VVVEEDPIAVFPLWHLVVDFLDLVDVLQARLVCRRWNSGLCESTSANGSSSGVSVQQCVRFLDAILQRQNVVLATGHVPTVDAHWTLGLLSSQPDWKRRERLASFLLESDGSSRGHFDKMLLVLRVLQHLPSQMGICYNSKWGRHAWAMQWNANTHTSEPRIYHPSSFQVCTTQEDATTTTPDDIPTVASGPANLFQTSPARHGPNNDYDIHDTLQLMKHKTDYGIVTEETIQERWDLNRYHHDPSLPNLPSDLRCPLCCSDRRTLQLSEFPYQSQPTNGDDFITPLGYRTANVLTLTPAETTNDHSSSSPSYQELAIPIIRSQDNLQSTTIPQLHPKPHLKHAMTLHCTHCRQFALVAPGGMCWSSKFPCKSRSKTFSIHESTTSSTSKTDIKTWMGGMLVRTRCSERNCPRPVFCHECSHATSHAHYPTTQQQQPPPPQLQHSSRCDHCHLDYCPAHAWLSTVCHHW